MGTSAYAELKMNEFGRNDRESHGDYVRAAVESISSAARSSLAASWRRSLLYHKLDPEAALRPERVETSIVKKSTERLGRLMRSAGPVLDHVFKGVGYSGCCVLLANSEGLVLDHRAKPTDDQMFGKWGLYTGSVWSEGNEGTNGIGTCLAEQRLVSILGNQHFHIRNAAMSCIGAPIFDENARLAAVLDVSSCLGDDQIGAVAALIAMVVSDSARKIENENFREAFPSCRIVVAPGHGMRYSSLLAVDRYDIVMGATRGARQILRLSEDALCRPLSDILTAERQFSDLKAAERAELQRALSRSKGDVSAAARDLGIGRATLYRKMKKLGIIGTTAA